MNKKVSKKLKITLLTAIGATLIIPGAVDLSMKAEAKPELAMRAEAKPELAMRALSGIHITDGGSHTDPPDVEGVYTALKIMGGSDDGSISDPPDVERLL